MDTFKIIVRNRNAEDSLATICELPDNTTPDQARAVFRNHFLKFADDDVVVELWCDQREVLN